jgi:hypothetical protein
MALFLMLQTINGGPWSWSYPIILGASILLLVGAVHVVASRVKKGWFAALPGIFPLIICGAFGGLPLICWGFSTATALVTWAGLALASALRRAATTGLMAALIIAAAWAPPSTRTLIAYFSPKPQDPNPATLLWVLVPWIFIVASIIAGIVFSKSPSPAVVEGKIA